MFVHLQHQQWLTVDDYEGEEGDLNFKKGEILIVLETRSVFRATLVLMELTGHFTLFQNT